MQGSIRNDAEMLAQLEMLAGRNLDEHIKTIETAIEQLEPQLNSLGSLLDRLDAVARTLEESHNQHQEANHDATAE